VHKSLDIVQHDAVKSLVNITLNWLAEDSVQRW